MALLSLLFLGVFEEQSEAYTASLLQDALLRIGWIAGRANPGESRALAYRTWGARFLLGR